MQYLMNPLTGSASVLPSSFFYLFFFLMWLYSALWYDALAVLHRQNLAFVAFLLFPLLVCIPLTLSLIPLSLVVMSTVRLSHVWGSHQGLDEAMINEREGEKAGMTSVRVTALLALFRTSRVRRSSPDTLALLFIQHTDIFLSLPLLYAFSLFILSRHTDIFSYPEKSSQL